MGWPSIRTSGEGLVEASRDENVAELEEEKGETAELDLLRLSVIAYMSIEQ